MGNIDPAYNGEYTVVGVADNGNRLIVKTNSFPKPPLTTASITYPANGKMSVSSTSYYQGDKLATDIRVDENTVLNIGITGEDGAFEKVIRALCMIAQGNLVDERNPMDAPDGVDANRALERVTEAMNLLDDALSHNNIKNSSESKSDLTQLNYKVGLNLKNVSTKITTQETLVKYLEDNIDGIEKMNPTEAAQLLQEQVTILEYSYAALSTVNSLSLMNYLK
ncbi:MAG: flagellar hook-associated protein FlgL [Alphaproteobacteria bacterium ADurb.Bin438]|nr:MAG: flagellar hook-associated protein FlgL [Alphaproteobacteria bacterium ADurb.Bin438]